MKGSESGIIYDKKVYTVKVTVTDNGDGTMTAKADMARGDIRFVNTTSDKTGDEAPLQDRRRGSSGSTVRRTWNWRSRTCGTS